MQWYDAYLWYLHDNGQDLSKCSFNNHIVTKFALITIMLEPIGQLFGYMYASKRWLGYKIIIIYFTLFIILPWIGRKVFAVQYDSYCNAVNNNCCSIITETNHILYGYARDSNGGFKCWNKYYFFGELQEDIPIFLRILFLIGIIYPYIYSNPFMPGLINASIITLSWILGFYSDAHASVWCFGASLQSIYLIFFDSWLFPNGYDRDKTQFKYYQINTKQGKLQKKETLKILQNRYNKSKIPKNLDVIIIGSGIGGLTTGALLAKTGKKVLVLEQHYRAGGCMHTFDEFGGEFDSGIHYVGSIKRVKLFLSFITNNLIEWYSMGTNNDNIYDTIDLDGIDFKNDVIQYRGGKDKLKNELIKKFPKSRDDINAYFNFLDNTSWKITYIYILSKIFPNSFLFNEKGYIYNLYIKPLMKYSQSTADQVISKYISDPKLRAIIGGGQLIDWCLIPNKASWWVVAAMMSYYIDGGYYPKGGSNNIPLSIIPIIKKYGGNVLCRAKVKEILVNLKNNTAYGVEMEKTGDIIKAPLIISGVGAHTLYWQLLSEKVFKQEIHKNNDINEELKILEEKEELEPSFGHMTAFITFDGTSKDLDLPDYNIHSWGNLKKYNYDIPKIQELFYKDPIKYGDEALICLTFPSAKDPYYDIKFPNKSNALLLTEAKYEWFQDENIVNNDEKNEYGKRTKSYKDFKNSFKDMFIKRLIKYCPKVKDKIIDIEIGSPLSSEFFLNTYKGGSYGISWSTTRFKHDYTKKYFHATASNINNLYITGESSLFGGFVGSMVSGYVSALKILGPLPMLKIILCTTRCEE